MDQDGHYGASGLLEMLSVWIWVETTRIYAHIKFTKIHHLR